MESFFWLLKGEREIERMYIVISKFFFIVTFWLIQNVREIYVFCGDRKRVVEKNVTNTLLFVRNLKLLLFEIICIRIWYLVPNICSRVFPTCRYTYVRVYGNRLDKLADPWFLLITAYSTTLIQLENGEISRYGCITQCPHSLFFPTPLPFFTLQNLTSGWNSIAIRSLTDRPISRDLIRAVIFFKKKGESDSKTWNFYIFLGEIICKLLWFCNQNSLSWTMSFSESISILQIFKNFEKN